MKFANMENNLVRSNFNVNVMDKNFLVNSIGLIMFWKYPSKTVSPKFGI